MNEYTEENGIKARVLRLESFASEQAAEIAELKSDIRAIEKELNFQLGYAGNNNNQKAVEPVPPSPSRPDNA